MCYIGHVLMENRNGMAVAGEVTQATGTAEREAALDLIDPTALAADGSRSAPTRPTMSKSSWKRCGNAR